MSDFWRNWLNIWCVGVAVFGLVLAGGAFEATSGPVRLLYGILGEPLAGAPDAPTRFSIALMGAVTLGWSLTFYAAFEAAHRLGERSGPIWRLVTLSVAAWYVIDGALSAATGYPLNIVPNTGLLVLYLIPILRSGALGGAGASTLRSSTIG